MLVWPQGSCVNYKVRQTSGLRAYSLGEVVKKLRFAGMESAEIVFLI